MKKVTPKTKPGRVSQADVAAEEEEKRASAAEEARVNTLVSTPTRKTPIRGILKNKGKQLPQEEKTLEDHVESYKASVKEKRKSKSKKSSRKVFSDSEDEEEEVGKGAKGNKLRREMSLN